MTRGRNELVDLLVLVGASVLLGLSNLAIRADRVPWIPDLPDPSSALCEAGDRTVDRISVTEAMALLDQSRVTFVDARARTDYETGHVPNAHNLPASDAAGLLEIQSIPIPPDDRVITYCDSVACERSEYLGLLLRDRVGCERVEVLEGGFTAWQHAGGAIERGGSP